MFDNHYYYSYCEAFNSIVDRLLRQAVPDHLQRFSEVGDWLEFWMELVIGLPLRTADMAVRGGFRSGEFGGHWSFLMNSRQLTWSHFYAMRAVCAGAPRRWKMNPPRSSWLQYSTSLGRKRPRYAASTLAFSSTTKCSRTKLFFINKGILPW